MADEYYLFISILRKITTTLRFFHPWTSQIKSKDIHVRRPKRLLENKVINVAAIICIGFNNFAFYKEHAC